MSPKLLHIDIFSGIGGFAYAIDQVWPDVEHIFCEKDPFCQQVIKKHWKGSKNYDDIRGFIADSNHWRPKEQKQQTTGDKQCNRPFILTGGFPCQPFSCAGKRKGTSDDRYLWPEMFRVIQFTKPRWVIAENVRGILTIEGGLVFEQVCLGLEACNYEVQPFIIPAVAVNAPHRRDRVWIIAYSESAGKMSTEQPGQRKLQQEGTNEDERGWVGNENSDDSNSAGKGLEREDRNQSPYSECARFDRNTEWDKNWIEIAAEFCGMDDELSTGLDFSGYTKSQHRARRLKALGNAIVPQVAIEIFKAIKYVP